VTAYPPSRVPRATHPVDVVLSVSGWILLVGGYGFLLMLGLFVSAISSPCPEGQPNTISCTDDGGALAVAAFACVVAYVVACVVSLVAIIVAFVRGASAWPWVAGAYALVALATVGFLVTWVIVTS
jgi:hypothetical protein